MERQQDYVLRTVEERRVRVVELWFTDVLGIPDALTFSFQYTGFSRVLVRRDGRRTLRSMNEHQHVSRPV